MKMLLVPLTALALVFVSSLTADMAIANAHGNGPPISVAEPSTLILLGTGIVGLAIIRLWMR